MDLDSLPKDDLERLKSYQRHRAVDKERRRCEALLAKKDRGVELTDAEKTYVAYSPYGTASTCGY